jgi:hypothetical protein
MPRPPDPSDNLSPSPLRHNRTLLAVAGAALFVGTILAVSGSLLGVALVLHHLLTDGLIVAAWIASAWGVGALVIRKLRHPGTVPSRALVVGTQVAIGFGCIGIATLGMGLAGWLARWSAILILAVGLANALRKAIRNRGAFERCFSRPPDRWSWCWLVVVPALAVCVLGSLLPAGLLWGDEPHGYDVLEYHLQVPREWFELGRIAPLTHNVFSYFPFGVEMHYLLAMHLRGDPWRAMFLAQLMHVAMAVLLVVAVYGVVRQLFGHGRGSAIAAALVGGSTPWLLLLAPVAYVEIGLLFFGALATGWFLRAVRHDSRSPRDALIAGALAGLACGAKLTAIPIFVVGLPSAALLANPRSFRQVLKGSAAHILAAVVVFSPWMVRTAVWTRGNPLFPEAARFFGKAHFSDVQVERWTRANHRPPQAEARARWRAIAGQIVTDWRFGYALLPLALVAGIVGIRDSTSRSLFIALALLLVFWSAFTHLQSRFFTPAIPLAALLIGHVHRRAWPVIATCAAALMVFVGITGAASKLDSINRRHLSATQGKTGIWSFLGFDGIDRAIQPALDELPPDATLVLIGDAQAYGYRRAMSRLRYRTVFDVHAQDGDSIIDGWLGRKRAENDVLLVDPAELERFSKTYWQIPPPPAELSGRTEPFVLK